MDASLAECPTVETRDYTFKDSTEYAAAQLLYMQGVSRAEIIKRLNVPPERLHKWVTRGKWVSKKDEIAPMLITGQRVTITQQERTFALRPILAVKAKGLIESLPSKCPKDPRGAKDVCQALALAVTATSQIEGWSDATQFTLDIRAQAQAPEEKYAVQVSNTAPELPAPTSQTAPTSTTVDTQPLTEPPVN